MTTEKVIDETPFIDRYQLLCELDRLKNAKTEQYRIGINAARDAVLNLEHADVVPVRHGKWIKPTRVPDSMLDECSLCGFDCGSYTYNYCPNCGAKMEETE